MRRILLALALAVSFATAIAGALIVTPRVPLLGSATELGRGELAWRIDRVVPATPAADAGLRAGDVLTLRSPYAMYRYRVAGDVIDFTRADGGAVSIRAGEAVVPRQTLWRRMLRAVRFGTHTAMCLLAAVLLWRSYGRYEARALAWFLVAFGFSLSFDATWFAHADGALANVALDGVIAGMLVAAVRFAAAIGRVEGSPRGRIANLSVAVGIAMVAAVFTLLALQYLRSWNEPILLRAWWAGWAVQLALTLIALVFGFEEARGPERRRLAYVAITFAVGFSGPIVATFGLAITGSAAGSPLYESLVAWRLTSIAIPLGFGYAVLFHHLLDIEFVFSRAMLYGLITSALVPVFAILRIVADKLAGKNIAAGSLISTVLTVLLLAYFEPIQRSTRSFLDRTLFRARTRELKALTDAAADLHVLSADETIAARVIETVRRSAGAGGATIYVADEPGFATLAGDLADAPARLAYDAAEVARVRRTQEALQPAGGAFGPAVLAVPMRAYGRLTGILAIGPKGDGQQYAPDEIAALTTLANAAAQAREALAVSRQAEELREARALRSEFARAIDALRAR